MKRDFRSSPEYKAVVALYRDLFGLTGHVFGARSLCGHTKGEHFHFIGQSFAEDFEDGVSNRLYSVARDGGSPVRLNDRETRHIRLSPDGRTLAVASAADDAGEDSIELWSDGRRAATGRVPGRIEQIDWAPDGKKLLLVVAGQDADLAGIHGGHAQARKSDAPAWLPEVALGEGDELWRRIWVWWLAGDPVAITAAPLNVWEASWCGPEKIAAITSDHHSEGSWYAARLSLIDIASRLATTLHTPPDQLGVPRGSPDGKRIAVIRAFCSDRGLVAGQLTLIDAEDGSVSRVAANGIDITSIEWRSATRLHLAGLRGHETVAADYDLGDGRVEEIWRSTELTSGEWAPTAFPVGEYETLLVAESWSRAPLLAKADKDGLREVASLAAPQAEAAMKDCGVMEPFAWIAPDGMEIEGWLLRPTRASGPAPLLVDIHGGPVAAHRNRWAARMRAAPTLAALGWAVLFPNPRGSTGRGDAFARAVKGDMGGADAGDILSGIDTLVVRGWVDTNRVAVTGASYGGFMSAWLPTLSDRFAAAIPISPVGDWYSQHRTTQIPEFDALFLDSSPWREGGAYFCRSPAFFRQKAKVPTLVMAGGIDKSTPPSQALECHFAALRSGSPSALVTYPNAGHSLRTYPEYLDSAARTVWWLETHVNGHKQSPTIRGA